jgi:hypothetical protein
MPAILRSDSWPVFALAACAAIGSAAPAAAQEFSRYLQCTGTMEAQGQQQPAHLDLALRFNNTTALIQRSNLLPVGERLVFTPSPVAYSMVYRLRQQGVRVWVVPGWVQNTVLVKLPNLDKINQIRLSIDRQTGGLEGVVLNEEDAQLAAFRMRCQSRSNDDMPAPKF